MNKPTLQQRVERVRDQIGFYRFATNWHKHPFLSMIMCYCGRHDYEYESTSYNSHGVIDGARLKCFYCLHEKGSYFSPDLPISKK